MWAVVPAKPFRSAKQRLAGILTEAERFAIARAMLEDVLEALGAVARLRKVAVVSTDAQVQALARRFGAMVVADRDEGQTAAVVRGLAAVAASGETAALVMSSDLPTVRPADVEALLDAHDAHPGGPTGITLATDRRRDGTNALVCSPARTITLSFGLGSRRRHLEAAREVGVPVIEREIDGLALDLDQPEDLEALLAGGVRGRARTLAEGWGVAARLAARPGVERVA